MARIVFAMLETYASHTASALNLARRLRARGHAVAFVGQGLDVRRSVEQAGFEYVAIGVARLLPRLRWRLRAPAALTELAGEALTALGGDFDLLVCDRFNPVAALLARRLGRRFIFLQTTIPSADPQSSRFLHGTTGDAARLARRYRRPYPLLLGLNRAALGVVGLLGLSTPRSLCRAAGIDRRLECDDPYDFLGVTTVVLCPPAFDLPQRHPPHYRFAAPAPAERDEAPYDWSAVDPNRRVLYVSFGSYVTPRAFPALYAWLRKAIEAFAGWQDWHVVVALGAAQATVSAGFRRTPGNVTLLGYAPQLAILRRATAMLTHGGLNSVLECIDAGVPMIVMPLFGDQFGNAARVVNHGLGCTYDYRREPLAALHDKAIALADDPAWARRLAAMRDDCRRPNPQADAIVEAALAG